MDLRLSSFALPVLAALAGCHGEHGKGAPGDVNDRMPFHAIARAEIVKFTGTEPFWSGEVADGRLVYVTPEDPKGTAVSVSRFAGRGGLSFSGELGGKPFTLALTHSACSDGMSGREYPFVATLRLGEKVRRGCGWTARQPWKEHE